MVSVERLSYKRIVGYTALALATLACIYVIYRLGQVVLLFVLSIIVAAALREPMLRLQRRGLPRGIAILLLYISILAVIGATFYGLGVPLGDELRLATERFPTRYDALEREWEAGSQQWQQVLAGVLPTTEEIVESLGENGSQVAYQLAGFSYSIANLLISLLAILTLTFYWLVDEDRFVRLWLMLLPVQQRIVARHTWQDIERRVGTFVRSEAIQFIATLLLLAAGFWAIGVRYPVTWALFGAFVQLIPWVGIPLTLLPAIPMYWTDPLSVMIGAIALVIVVGTLMDRVVEPRMGVVGIVHPIVSVLALMVLGEAVGLLGMLVALPLAATVQSVLSQIVQANSGPRVAPLTIYSTQLQELRARAIKAHTGLAMDREELPAVEDMFKRLEGLLDKTEQVVQERATPAEQRRMPGNGEAKRRIPQIFARHR
jgi:predicted PurR-regulated permease PerM